MALLLYSYYVRNTREEQLVYYDCLIIDDEEALGQSTCEYFNLFEVTTHWAKGSKECFDFLSQHSVGLILLDINLNEESGFELCKRLRKDYDMPILFISARRSDDDILLALGLGGDDYIAKPFSLSVLLAKVKRVLQRYSDTPAPHEPSGEVFHFADFSLDLSTMRLMQANEEVKLKSMEYKLLVYLVQNSGKVVTKEEIFRNVWEHAITGDGTLNVHIRRLREKIEKDPNNPVFIKTVWGTGYRFEVSEA